MAEFSSELIHHGILGMKWGHRKPESDAEEQAHPDHLKAKELRARPTSSLSNSEFQTLNSRLQLEQNYSNLKSSQSNIAKIKRGNEAVKVIVGVGTTAATIYGLSKTPLGMKAISIGKSVLSSDA